MFSGHSHKSQAGRESPIGAEREREFPTTKIGSNTGLIPPPASADHHHHQLTQPGSAAPAAGQMAGDTGAGHERYSGDRYHGHSSRCSSAAHGQGHGSVVATPSNVQSRSIITGDLVQSRDFHYSVEQPPLYR